MEARGPGVGTPARATAGLSVCQRVAAAALGRVVSPGRESRVGKTSALTPGPAEGCPERAAARRLPRPSGGHPQRPFDERTEAPGKAPAGAALSGPARRVNGRSWPLPGAVAEAGLWSCDAGKGGCEAHAQEQEQCDGDVETSLLWAKGYPHRL